MSELHDLPAYNTLAERLVTVTAERDRARATAVALEQRLTEIEYQYAATIDGEWGCCHDAEELRRGGRAPQFDGDTFDPLPPTCAGSDQLHILRDPEETL
jgi:hypothetical protein